MKRKKFFSLVLFSVFTFSMIGCTPTAEPTAAPAPDMHTIREYVPAKLEHVTQNKDGITYTVAKYSEAIPALYSYGGTNLSLNKPVTVSGSYMTLDPRAINNGNLNDLWGSEDVPNPWAQIDLGEAKKIGRVEVRGRTDGNNTSERIAFEIRVSNDPEFNTYEVIHEQGASPFEYLSTLVVNCPLTEPYRYVRLQRTYGWGHFTLSEVSVFDTPAVLDEPDPVEDAPAGAKMIVSRSGKALSLCGDAAALVSYDFKNSQRWTVEEAEGGFRLRSVSEGKYLSDDGGKLVLSDNGSLFIAEKDAADWVRLSTAEGHTLVSLDGMLALCDRTRANDDVYGRFVIYDAYTETLPVGDTDWMKNRFGVMFHLLPDSTTVRSMHNRFDYDGIADQLAEVGAGYFMLSVGQNSGYYNTYSPMYESIVSRLSNARFTKEDIISNMYTRLAERNIDLMIYATTGPPSAAGDYGDFCMKDDKHTRDSAMLWSFVLRDWALTYGDKALGWWLDGGYSGVVSDPDMMLIIANGIKSGNPKAAISFNPGIVVMENSPADEFTCGETDFPLGKGDINDRSAWLTPDNWFPIRSQQWFELTFLNVGWCNNTAPRTGLYSPEIWGEYVKTVLDQGGGICLDVTHNAAEKHLIIDSMMDILRGVNAAVNGK